MNRNRTKTWKKKHRQRRTGNPNHLRSLPERWGKGQILRSDNKIVRRARRKKRLPTDG